MADSELSGQYYTIVPAAGVGRRMGTDTPKQYLSLMGKTVLEHTLTVLLAQPQLQRVVVAVSPEDDQWRSIALMADSRIAVVEGGAERSYSVLNGLRFLAAVCGPGDWVLVHDVARPCISGNSIQTMIDVLQQDPVGGILALPASDTIKQVAGGEITHTIDRDKLWHAQTPQLFRYALLFEALTAAIEQHVPITDEASALELAGFRPKVVLGSVTNIKITHPEDLALAEFYLQKQQRSESVCE